MNDIAPKPYPLRNRIAFWSGTAAAGVVAFMLWASQTEQFGPYGRFWSFMYGTSSLAVICAVLAVKLRFWLLWLPAVLLFLPMLGYILLGAIIGGDGKLG